MPSKKTLQFPPKAYKDEEFINSSEARPVRILAEYLEPKARFAEHNVQDTILFFGLGPYRVEGGGRSRTRCAAQGRP